jgi:glycosyltransferase involved in cell wall biosynthesis
MSNVGGPMQVRAAFVVEQTLGHVTHTRNLEAAAAAQDDVAVTWVPVDFPVSGIGGLVPAYRSNWSVRASWRARTRLLRERAFRSFDVLFFHTQVTALFCADLMRRIPSVVSLDATPINFDTVGASYGHRPAAGGWLDGRKFQLNRSAFAAARALVSWSDWAARSLVADYGVAARRINVLAPGAARAYFEIGERRARRSAATKPVRLLFVGGDFARKGGPALLAAARAARTRAPFELHIVTRDDVPAQDGVFVHHGVRPNSPELLALIERSDVFVLPSLGECLSVALMEAAAAGLPIVTTDVGALREAALDEQTAIVMSPGDGAALRAAIERLVDDEPRRRSLGAAGHALACEKFDAERNNGRIFDLVRSLAAPMSGTSVA